MDPNDDDAEPPKYTRRTVRAMHKGTFEAKYGKTGGKCGYLEKNLRDWAFKDVLDFFQKSVTNDKKCIETITTREVRA
jgi:hypothetical protein